MVIIKMNKKLPFVFLGMLVMISFGLFAQQQINLQDQLQNKKLKVVNRQISPYSDSSEAVEMDMRNSSGLGILEDIEFFKGTIEVELLGENNPGKSFLGIAFNIHDDSTYEAVYFRPFNFIAEEPLRKSHMVQYIFHPEFTWKKLREERTGEFEKEISDPPNPDDWFKAVIKIDEERVEVYVNDISKPVLIVDRLATTKSSLIGIWTGYGSSGRFRNMVLKPE